MLKKGNYGFIQIIEINVEEVYSRLEVSENISEIIGISVQCTRQ